MMHWAFFGAAFAISFVLMVEVGSARPDRWGVVALTVLAAGLFTLAAVGAYS